jgi:hypothetical protein
MTDKTEKNEALESIIDQTRWLAGFAMRDMAEKMVKGGCSPETMLRELFASALAITEHIGGQLKKMDLMSEDLFAVASEAAKRLDKEAEERIAALDKMLTGEGRSAERASGQRRVTKVKRGS